MNVFREEIAPEGFLSRAVRHVLVRLEGKAPLDLVEKIIETPFETRSCPFTRDGFKDHHWVREFSVRDELKHLYKCTNCGAKMTMRWSEG